MNLDEDAAPEQGAVKVRLKWFNGPKGFGFVVPDGEEIDAFIHVTTLQRANVTALGEGARLLCHIERGPKGAQVRHVVRLLEAGEKPQAIGDGASGSRDCPTRELQGTVKWYRPEKGFGFVAADDGEKDIFIHKSCLERYGLSGLEPGTRLSMKVKLLPKGREVLEFDFIQP